MSDHLKPIIEALIFASPEPITAKTLYKLLDGEPKEDVDAALAAVRADYERPGGLQIVEVAGGYQITTKPELHEWVRKLFHERTTQKLSVQALETLAVIAYKQPVTAPEIAEIRGVSSSTGVLQTLIERKLMKTRRAQAGGRPSVHVRHDARIPRAVRAERHRRSAEGRRVVGRARLRAARRLLAEPTVTTSPLAVRGSRGGARGVSARGDGTAASRSGSGNRDRSLKTQIASHDWKRTCPIPNKSAAAQSHRSSSNSLACVG